MMELLKYSGLVPEDYYDFEEGKKISLEGEQFKFFLDKVQQFLGCGFTIPSPSGLTEFERLTLLYAQEKARQDKYFAQATAFRMIFNDELPEPEQTEDNKEFDYLEKLARSA